MSVPAMEFDTLKLYVKLNQTPMVPVCRLSFTAQPQKVTYLRLDKRRNGNVCLFCSTKSLKFSFTRGVCLVGSTTIL